LFLFKCHKRTTQLSIRALNILDTFIINENIHIRESSKGNYLDAGKGCQKMSIWGGTSNSLKVNRYARPTKDYYFR